MSRVLVVGSGGREHALAWKLAESSRVDRVFVAPGNGGSARAGGKIENVAIPIADFDGLISFARKQGVVLTVVGPENPLVDGIVDEFNAAGLACFGPVAGAARLEGSKWFAKELMDRTGVPTAGYRTFTDARAALDYVRAATTPLVVKASGLAAGKGVVVTSSSAEAETAVRRIMVEREFGAAGDEVVIEERLTGQEASVLAFCDGTTLVPMPPAQDHKPLLDGDRGPNTGGMGAYAPTPLVDEGLVNTVVQEIMAPVVQALAADGDPFVGVLYAGLMITPAGPKVLEFNTRFGDPETQVVLPLLTTDLFEILAACVEGTLHDQKVEWRDDVAAAVVAASPGYPGSYPTGLPITGLSDVANLPGVTVFHAGTAVDNDGLVTSGGRVLAVTAVEPDLPSALASAYRGIKHLHFEGMHYRSDIGKRSTDLGTTSTTYAGAGVDIDAGARVVALIEDEVRSTYGPEVIAGIGAFGGMFDASRLEANAVLVASTDGVGTKTKIASALQRYDTIGTDLVNHCVNDILVQGARPLFFLDYVAAGRLDPNLIAALVSGMATACRAAGCALLGGETAEMPGVYLDGEFDVVGTIVGVVERDSIVAAGRASAGDVVIGLPSSGLHTNGYSLAREVFQHRDLNEPVPALGTTLGNALLAPHRSYLAEIENLHRTGVTVRGLAHITGGGLIDNPPRILSAETAVRIERKSWEVPPLFTLIRAQGNIDEREMYRTFNMGIGMLVVVSAGDAAAALANLGPEAVQVGEIVPRTEAAVELI